MILFLLCLWAPLRFPILLFMWLFGLCPLLVFLLSIDLATFERIMTKLGFEEDEPCQSSTLVFVALRLCFTLPWNKLGRYLWIKINCHVLHPCCRRVHGPLCLLVQVENLPDCFWTVNEMFDHNDTDRVIVC